MYEDLLKNYRMIYDHHTHTIYTHGKSTVEENVKVAISKGLKSIAITEHGPGNIAYGINDENLSLLKKDIEELRVKYPEIEILYGIELNTIPVSPYLDMESERLDEFDIVLAGYHYGVLGAYPLQNYIWNKTHKNGLKYTEYEEGVFQPDMSGLLVKNTQMMLNAIYSNKIDIVTHVGDKGPFDVYDIAKACEETNTLMEINDNHKHLNVEELKIAKKFDVKFVLSSDAHVCDKVGTYLPQLECALLAGIELERIVNIEKI